MPFESALPAPTIRYDREMYWPANNRDSNISGSAFLEQYGIIGPYTPDAAASSATFVQMFGIDNGSSGGPASIRMAIQDGLWCASRDQVAGEFAAVGMTPSTCRGPLVSAGLPAGFRGASIMRVYRATWLYRIANVVANPPPNSGTGLILCNQGIFTAWPSAGNQLGGMIFCGDGAGALEYRTYEQAPAFPGNLLTSTPVTAFVFDQWNTMEIEVILASGSRDGTCRAFCNGEEVASHSFATGDLPVYGVDAAADPTTRFQWARRDEDEALYQVGPIHIRQGRFTRAGLELTS